MLVRQSREQRRVHERLEFLIIALEVKLHVGAVGIDCGRVDRGLLNWAGAHLFIKHSGLNDCRKRSGRHRIGGEDA